EDQDLDVAGGGPPTVRLARRDPQAARNLSRRGLLLHSWVRARERGDGAHAQQERRARCERAGARAPAVTAGAWAGDCSSYRAQVSPFGVRPSPALRRRPSWSAAVASFVLMEAI